MRPLPIRRISESDYRPLDRSRWPATLPPIRQLLDEGLEPGRITVLVGENGSGKSTLVEAVAMAYGLSPEGGSTGAMHSTRSTESGLNDHLRLERGPGASRWGYFLRAETMHGLFTYLEDHPGPRDPAFHRMSHGDSFMAMITDPNRFDHGGLFVLDEPEAGLSFVTQLTLLGQLIELAADDRTQLIIATHSPIIARLPGATLLQLDADGIAEVDYDDLAMVNHYRSFLDGPERYLHHIR